MGRTHLGVVVEMVPAHLGFSGERGGGRTLQRAPGRRRRSGPTCVGGRELLKAPGLRVSLSGDGPESPGKAETATAKETLTDRRSDEESRPQQFRNSLSSHFGSLRLRGRF